MFQVKQAVARDFTIRALLMTTTGLMMFSASAAAAPTGSADTLQASNQIEEIVVTAQRREEKLQDVPIAISAVTAGQLESSGVTDTLGLQQVVPSLRLAPSATWEIPRIRGVGNSAVGPGQENAVATYVDGVYIASTSEAFTSLINVERVEVLKGPQGTLFGRNATGGLIQVITRTPQQEASGFAHIGYGNYERIFGDFYVTGGLGENLSADLAVQASHQAKGQGINLFNNKTVGREVRSASIRSKLLWKPDDDTSALLAFDYHRTLRDDISTDYPGLPNKFFQSVPPGSGVKVLNVDEPTSLNEVRGGGVSATLRHDFGGVEIVSITAYRKSTAVSQIEGDHTPVLIFNYGRNRLPEKQFSQELQLLSTETGSFNWVGGLYYFRSSYGYDPLRVNLGPNPSGLTRIDIIGRGKTDSVAGYAQGSYEIQPDTNLTVGARYTYEKRRVKGANGLAFGSFYIPPTFASYETSFKKPTWRVSLDHRFSPELLGYISYNRGFKSGGFDMASPATSYKPEGIDAYEVGLKSDLLDNRLRINAAAYYYKYTNVQVAQVGGGGAIFTFNGAAAEIYGGDVDAEVRIGRQLRVNAALSIIHDRFTSFPNGIIYDFAPGPNYLGSIKKDLTGFRLPQTPDFSASLGASYTMPTSVGEFVANGNMIYATKTYTDPGNQLFQKAYTLVNVALTYKANDRISVRAYANNLFDVTYMANGTVASPNVSQYLVGEPRTYGVQLGYQF